MPAAPDRRFIGPGVEAVITGPRPGRLRDRRGRGFRGPLALPGPLSPQSVPRHRSPAAIFDLLVSDILAALESHFARETQAVEVVVEEAPLLPQAWSDPVPTSAVIEPPGGKPDERHDPPAVAAVRLVLYRMPLSRDCASMQDLEETLWAAILDALAQIWQVPPDSLDPRR